MTNRKSNGNNGWMQRREGLMMTFGDGMKCEDGTMMNHLCEWLS